ncbi:hypothetical protein WJX81_002619 [Elliptochloris bilobata]|uniref:Uncharacterized protein n=1 Tax=Elliptochloris bilobata TaxID=381761 RepID=A0AAW1QIL3_9CHLO
MFAITLVGLAVGFVLLRVEALVEEGEFKPAISLQKHTRVQERLRTSAASGPQRNSGAGPELKRVRLQDVGGEEMHAGRLDDAGPSLASTMLDAASSRSQAAEPSPATLKCWVGAYKFMAQEALALGIPKSAIPMLSAQPTAQELRTARERLEEGPGRRWAEHKQACSY